MDLQDAQVLAQSLLAEHGLTGWQLRWDRAVRRAGSTRFADRTISLSRRLTAAHDESQVRETLLHEIAHALVGTGHGHDEVWRRTARGIGASGRRCLDAAEEVPGRWTGTCPAGHVTTRHRIPTRVVSCRRCSTTFDLAHVYTWTRDGQTVPMHPAYAAELARLHAVQRRSAPSVGSPDTDEPTARRDAQIATGRRVRITAPGRYEGRIGVVRARRRTRYAVQLGGVVVAVPFPFVEPW